MNVKRWRVPGVVAAIAGGSLILSGCSGGGGGALGEGGGDGSSLVVITNESPWLGAYEAAIKVYEEESGVSVDLRTVPYDEVRTQILNDVQSGSHAYDVYQLDEPWMPEFFENEWVVPFTDIDPSYKEDPAINSYGNFTHWDAEKRISSESGEAMSIPLNGNIQILSYRTDVYDELGAEPPTTWAEAIQIGKEAQEQGLANYGYTLRTQGSKGGGTQVTYDFLAIMYSYGANWFKDEGTDWTPNLSSPEGIKAATTLRELAKLGPSATATIGQAQVIGAMQAGETAQVQAVAAAAPNFLDEANSNVVENVGFAPLPGGDAGPAAASGVWALTVPAGLTDERSQAALDFITWMGSKEAQVAFTEAGGIPTRDDILESVDVSDGELAYLNAIQEALPNVNKHVRYTFGAKMAPITEKYLAQIAAGSISPEEGVKAIDEELTPIIEEAGYPMGGGK
ncbi:extracellular solute-binding protein [Paramicrobacterium agarici]|uniref:extracellular solute-binding protein n=1 Tax=Paramicrobacterium agarici TaxID=630514 RepID=UPI001153899E|nr:extracellular solute-binding protein [Microbacterium agarici]TQO22754.1 carbohydrate ABC transporter substrate-binding protein (CUT1 family) [Microbacterium agarici]